MESLDFMYAIVTVALIVVAAATVAALYQRYVPAGKAHIQVIAVYLSAGDNLLDVRYRVTRSGRVLPLDEIMIQGANGQPAARVASVARIGRLASRSALHRTGGFVLFRNVGGVARGDLVTVAVGRRQEALTVT
jgi:hypothetical protein